MRAGQSSAWPNLQPFPTSMALDWIRGVQCPRWRPAIQAELTRLTFGSGRSQRRWSRETCGCWGS